MKWASISRALRGNRIIYLGGIVNFMKPVRYERSDAYIDSSQIVAFLFGVVVFSSWIAYQTREVISPWWLGVSIVIVTIYQMVIFWLIRQYWEPDKILGIFTSNLMCLGLIFALVSFVTGITLPTDLPILNFTLYLAGIQATSIQPGAVALSYAVLAIWVGLVAMFVFGLVDRTKAFKKIMKVTGLSRVDLHVDWLLDKYSLIMDQGDKAWLITPQAALIVTLTVVVGLAALL